jgi:hypothetical protein
MREAIGYPPRGLAAGGSGTQDCALPGFLTLCLLHGLLLAGPRASDEVVVPVDPAVIAAEYERLSEEMEQLARRQIWVGLEDKFREIQALGVPLRVRDLVHGAHAARALGDVQTTWERLQAACALSDEDELVDWLRAIESEYGQVALSTSPQRSVQLQPDAMPFAPDRRAAVDFAARALAEQGEFEGRLPAGSYQLASTSFEVEPGISLRIEVSTRRQRGRKDEELQP